MFEGRERIIWKAGIGVFAVVFMLVENSRTRNPLGGGLILALVILIAVAVWLGSGRLRLRLGPEWAQAAALAASAVIVWAVVSLGPGRAAVWAGWMAPVVIVRGAAFVSPRRGWEGYGLELVVVGVLLVMLGSDAPGWLVVATGFVAQGVGLARLSSVPPAGS